MAAPLDNLVRIGLLKEEPTSAGEIGDLVAKAVALLDGARQITSNPISRFALAYDAAHALALAALRAHDKRPTQEKGHRAVVFQTLGTTVGAPDKVWSTLDTYHARRNRSEYGGAAAVSRAEADELLDLATQLDVLFQRWLRGSRPELLSSGTK
jgi:hypothetical protein